MFDFGGFDFGASSLPSISNVVPSAKPVTVATVATSVPWYQSLINDGLNAYNMVAKNDLASQQIKAGQQPTVLGLPGMSSVASISSSWVFLAIAIVVLVILLRR